MSKTFICTKTEPIVNTKAGKIRGFIYDGTYTFHGIRYAQAKRFQSPTEVDSWEGVKDALSYGFVCPMLTPETAMGEIMVPHRYWPKSEHCQYLNIWSQSVDHAAKKPVVVWLHGGGFAAGSSIEQVAYDGENLSRFGDVVVVSLNHRLNILGYFDLSAYGEEYKNSANAGSEDMVAALRWIRDNIENFGGDPENVTLFGQSGGGMKVWSLLQCPDADGLFHKGIIQSGVLDGFFEVSTSDKQVIVEKVLEELGRSKEDVHQLAEVPYEILAQAYNKVWLEVVKSGKYVGGNPIPNDFYLGDPLKVGFRKETRHIPIMIGTVFGEFAFGPGVEGKSKLTEAEELRLIHNKYKEEPDQLVQLFRQAYPNKRLTDLLDLDSMFRYPTIDFVEKRAHCEGADVYSFMFAYEFPYDDGKPAWHCSEIPFIFHNTDKVPICNRPGISELLEEQMAASWVQFAKSGNPNHSLIPKWEKSDVNHENIMIFDEKCEVRANYDHELVRLHKRVAPKFRFGEEEILH